MPEAIAAHPQLRSPASGKNAAPYRFFSVAQQGGHCPLYDCSCRLDRSMKPSARIGYAITFLICRNGFTHPTNDCSFLLIDEGTIRNIQ